MQDILILIPCLCKGGTELATLETAMAMKANGFHVEIQVYFDEIDSYIVDAFSNYGIKITRLDLPRKSGVFEGINFALKQLECLGRRRYKFIWVQYMTPTLLPLLLARLYTGRLIAAVHVAPGHHSPSGLRRLRWLARWWCDRFVCVSHTTARGIFGSMDPASPWSGRVAVLPNALDMNEVEAALVRDWRGELSLPTTAKIGGYVGRLAHNKGVDILIWAAALLHPANPELHWVIVGDGADRGELEALASELGVASVMHFVGALTRSEVLAAFKGFEIAVVPSREEGFGLSALEAMACGIPLVASRVDALAEVVLDGSTGMLFQPESPADLASVVSRVLADSMLQVKLSKAGRAHVRHHYDREAYQMKLKHLLAEVGSGVA